MYIINEQTILSQIETIKQKYKNKKIGVVFSCFDLIHPGHIVMLKDAKDQCDVLIVGLQSDPTIDRPEKNKPIQSLAERDIMIESIKYVDEVIYYEREFQLHLLLSKLQPDVRILGSDWKNKKFTGYDLPIPIYWHKRNHEWSTSSLRKRIYDNENQGAIKINTKKGFKK